MRSSARAVSGVLAGGLVTLAVVVLGAAILGLRRDFPGPGAESLVAHLLAAVLAVVVQTRADRGRGGGLALALMLIIAGVLLWTQWWN